MSTNHSAPAALAASPRPRPGPGVTFATTEHFNLQTARALTVSEANGRASIYLAALSSNLIALAFIGQISRLGMAFYLFALILLKRLSIGPRSSSQRRKRPTGPDGGNAMPAISRRLDQGPPPRLPGARLLAVGLRILPFGTRRCQHFHESTTRYDHDQKLLSFLLVCGVCGTEKLVHSQPYEPRFEPYPGRGRERTLGHRVVESLPGA